MIYPFHQKAGFLICLTLVALFFTSCNNDDDGTSTNDDITSITISSNSGTELEVNQETMFSIKSNKGEDITSKSEIFVEQNLISSNNYKFVNAGEFTVYAKYKDIVSNQLVITVKEENSTSTADEFTSKIIVHDFTGTWCGYCAAALLELYEKAEKFPNALVPIEIHGGGSGNAADGIERFDFPNISVFGVDGFPSIWHNFDANHEYFAEEDMANYIANKSKTGLAINYDLSGNIVKVRIKSNKEINGRKLAVYLLEGGLISNQTNYDNNNPSSPSYQKGDVIENLEYKNVARASLTDSPLGTEISDATGNEYEISFSLNDLTDKVKDMKNTKVVAALLENDGSFINAQSALANENKDFD